MALTGNLTIEKNGLTEIYPQCYARIMTAVSMKYLTYATVNFYSTIDVRLEEGLAVKAACYEIESYAGMKWEEIYVYLKTLPEFNGWTDALDELPAPVVIEPTQPPAEA